MRGRLGLLPISSNKTGWPWTEETDPKIYDRGDKWPKISIVTPSLNQGDFIEETIRSILLQNYPNLEYVIIDGGSTDQTIEVIKKYSAHIDNWVSEKDSGQSNAINKGLQSCSGQYFNWLNSDDFLSKDALYHMASQIDHNTDIIAGYCTVFIDSTKEIELKYRLGIGDEAEKAIVDHSISQPSMFYKTEILKTYNGVNESLHYVMDLALFIQYVSEHGLRRIKLIQNDMAYFRKHSHSKTVSIQKKFEYEERRIYSYLLTLSQAPAEAIGLISENIYYPKKRWVFNLNSSLVQKWIFIRFLLNEASKAYAQSDYFLMKEFLNQYSKMRKGGMNLTFIKLLIISKIPVKGITYLRKVFNSLLKRKKHTIFL